MSFAIRVDNLGKRYQLGATHAGSIRELVNRGWNRLRGRTEEPIQPVTLDPEAVDRVEGKDFWALKDVSFEVKQGEVVGIIGRNGSGKSTLLKILSQITAPTQGRVELHGRVASLLEVGTGFHPELSGRENVFLNGAILGMTKPEISRKFDEIVAFSEIEKFIDTPVKRYSSGMYIRLAFAVAAHLEPEILIIDEVLAVGDAGFQKKCLGKMSEAARGGRTVLFVSHNIQAITMLCERAILLQTGQLMGNGPAQEVMRSYLEAKVFQSAEKVWDSEPALGDEVAKLMAVRVLDEDSKIEYDHDISNPISVEMEVAVLKPGFIIETSIHVINQDGLCLFAVVAALNKYNPSHTLEPGIYRSTCRVPANLLNDGKHYVSAFLVRNHADVTVRANEVVSFIVHEYRTSEAGWMGKIIGAVRPLLLWDIERIGELK